MSDGSRERHQLERLIFFSDAVFAIAMTLLVVDVRVPPLAVVSDATLIQALADLIPQYIGFLISFLVAGRFWVGHHRFCGRLVRSDERLVGYNLLFLLTIAFMPFPTTLISRFPQTRVGVGVYAAWLVVAGLANLLGERHAFRAGLIAPAEAAEVHRLLRGSWAPVVIGVTAAVAGMVAPLLALLPLSLSPLIVRAMAARPKPLPQP